MQKIAVTWRRHLEAFLDAVIGPSAPAADQLELPLWKHPIEAQRAANTISLEPRDPPGGGGLPIPKKSTVDADAVGPRQIDRAA